MSSIAEKLRAARRFEIKVGDITFFGTRATPEQLIKYASKAITDAEVCRFHIDNWKGAKECDLIEGGSKEPVKFDSDDFSEVIGEKPEWYNAIAAEILKNAQETYRKKNENEKNLKAGSTTNKSDT